MGQRRYLTKPVRACGKKSSEAMNTTTLNSSTESTGILGQLVGAVRKVSAFVWEMHQIHVTHSELSALSDRELLDIGLLRSDIRSVAEGTFRRTSEPAVIATEAAAVSDEQDYRLAA
jgi:uncharacterized protein YjiS (DUF1127 family)